MYRSMKKLFIVANWKSHKTTDEAIAWLQQFSSLTEHLSTEKEIIICPSFPLLPAMHAFIQDNTLPIKLGAQDVSPFGEGPYTGAVNAKQIKEFAEYVIIGHSERRNSFSETDEILDQKVQQACSVGLTPIFCIQSKNTLIPDGVTMVAFEPIEAIGTGHPDTPEDASQVAEEVKESHPSIQVVLYGGSVVAGNVKNFTNMQYIDGSLVGGASLDATKFREIITNS